MKAVLINYDFDPEWLLKYPDLEPIIYDRSDDGVERNLTKYGQVFKTQNRGDVDYDKLSWIVENYDNLPEIFLWSKTNVFKFVEEESFQEALKANQFAPLFRKDHRTYSDKFGVVCDYKYGIYRERADSWFFHQGLDTSGYFVSWADWCHEFYLPQESMIPFAPGGSYILTKDRILRYSKDFYESMRNTLPYAAHPVEAHCCERSYFYLWR